MENEEPTLQPTTVSSPTSPEASGLDRLIPRPLFVEPGTGNYLLRASELTVQIDPGEPELQRLAEYLISQLSAGSSSTTSLTTQATQQQGGIYLSTKDSDHTLGEEGYELSITAEGIKIAALCPAGIFYGIQTLRQLLPPTALQDPGRSAPWSLPLVHIRDTPRFTWRGAMLDVSRHFFGVKDVERYIDLLSFYKMNRLHLHLADDQGWRLMINSWPNLAVIGGSTAVGGDRGGYYTQEEYAHLVAYAQERFITLIPEIETPGHTNAALASYAELNCNDVAPSTYTGIGVGFSSLCIGKEITYTFLADVLGEIAALTPGPYLHIGGDEAEATHPADYIEFISRVQEIVSETGKIMVGWEEIAHAQIDKNTLVQYWNTNLLNPRFPPGVQLIMSPASHAYMDMKYTTTTELGLEWAGLIDVRTSYEWDPASLIDGVGERQIAGVEAPLWTETIRTMEEIEYMVFPRILSIAEIGWSPAALRSWDEYRLRLAAHAPHMDALNINYHHSPEISW